MILEQKPHLSALSRPLVLFTHKFFFRVPYTRFFLPVHTHRLNFWVNARFEKKYRSKSNKIIAYLSVAQNNRVLCTVNVWVCMYVCAAARWTLSGSRSLNPLKPDPAHSRATPPRHQPLAFRVLARPPRDPMCALNKPSAWHGAHTVKALPTTWLCVHTHKHV